MDADQPKLKSNPAQEAFDKNEAQYAAYWARKNAEREARERTHPDEKPGTGWSQS